ncbi:hypothetical protein [Streptomyces sp. WMMC905]|uniref:hypothetical protein n=1 Tax=Streptomyces sp. WMMC905 TaxID=3404123 RepID=UPI003B94479F
MPLTGPMRRRPCGASAISVPVDTAGDLKIAKFRQDSHYLSLTSPPIYKPIRSHNEDLNGRLKGAYMDVGTPMHRRAPGQVAQTILIAIMLAIGNLDILETWLYERTGFRLSDADFDSIPAAPGRDWSSAPTPLDMGRHPPARHLPSNPPDPIRRHPPPRTGIERPPKRRRSRPILRSDGISSTLLS